MSNKQTRDELARDIVTFFSTPRGVVIAAAVALGVCLGVIAGPILGWL